MVEIEHDAHVRDAVALQSLDDGDLMILLLEPWLAMIVESHFATERGRILCDGPDACGLGFDALGIVRHRDGT